MTVMDDASWLREVPRELSPAEVELAEAARDRERGPYLPHGEVVHHGYQEARH